MAKKCSVFVISNKLFFHRHFALFLDYNPVGLHAYVGVLLTVNHWFLSLQYAFARVRRFHALSISPETMSGVPISILSRLTALSCSCMILLSRGGKCCNIQLVGESKAVRKVFTKVSQVSHCPKWNYVFCLSHYLSIYYLFYYNFIAYLVQWYSGTLGTLFLSFPSLLPSP